MQPYSHVHVLVVLGGLLLVFIFYIQEQIIASFLTFIFITLTYLRIQQKRRKLYGVLNKYGYTASPVRDLADFIKTVLKNPEQIEMVIGRKFEYFKRNTEWKDVVEISEALLATDASNRWYRHGIPDSNRVLVARQNDGNFLLGYLLHNYTDVQLQKYIQEMKDVNIPVDVDTEIVGVI